MLRIVFAAMLSLALSAPAQAGLAARAESYVGKTARDFGFHYRQWCADFMNMLLAGGTHDRRARSYATYGTPAAHGCVDCIAVMNHHVGVVKGYDANGNPVIVSGNHGREVGVGTYPRGRIKTYRNP